MSGPVGKVPLALDRCQPQEGQPEMAPGEVQAHLALVPGWVAVDGALMKRFGFSDFHRTMAFVNALAWVAHAQDHHPELALSWGQCTVRFSTHAVGGLSINDFICAAKVDALLEHGCA